MVISLSHQLTSGYVWLEADKTQVKQATLHYTSIGGQWHELTDSEYPFEFTVPLGANVSEFQYSVEAVKIDDSREVTGSVNLPVFENIDSKKISGKIINIHGGAVDGVELNCGDGYSVFSDEEGNYQFDFVSDGAKDVVAQKEGFFFWPASLTAEFCSDYISGLDFFCSDSFFTVYDKLNIIALQWLAGNEVFCDGLAVCEKGLAADISGDCRVDQYDFALLAETTGTAGKIDPSTIGITASSESTQWGQRLALYAVNGAGLAGDAHINSVNGTMWMSYSSSMPQWLKIDLSDIYYLDRLKIWNFNMAGYTGRGVKDLEIFYSSLNTSEPGDPLSNPGNWYYAGHYTLTEAPGEADYGTANEVKPDEIYFPGNIYVRWMYIKVNSSFDGSYSGLSEIQFYGY
jgi:hypothetical protein